MEIFGKFSFWSCYFLVGGSKVISGELTTGEFSSFHSSTFMLYTPIKRISGLYNKMQDALAANERINSILKNLHL